MHILRRFGTSLLKLKAYIALSYSFLKSQCGGGTASIGAKMAFWAVYINSLIMIEQKVGAYLMKFDKYALVRLNVQKTCFKSKTANPGFGHF